MRSEGYRIYYEKAGFRPHVRPLLRAHRAGYGIDLDVLEPAAPLLECWRPPEGPEADRLAGFPLVRPSGTAAWRCRRVGMFAEESSTRIGAAIFTCRNAAVRLTCRNHGGHGFWINRAAFGAF